MMTTMHHRTLAPAAAAAAAAAAASTSTRTSSCCIAASSRRVSRPSIRTQLRAPHQQGFQVPGVRGGEAGRKVVCRSALDDPELEDLVAKMEALRPEPPTQRPLLEATIKAIDAVNSADPTKVPIDGVPRPYRVLYSDWVSEWVRKLDPKAQDELLILAKGRNIESWKLSEIKRDAYPPNSAGVRMWEGDRKRWLAARLEEVMKEAGYPEQQLSVVREVMLNRDIPNPRDMRRFDLQGPLGATNFRLLEQAYMVQVLKDAEAMVFMEKNFPQMSSRMSSEEIITILKKELGGVSKKCMEILLAMPWSPLQLKMISKTLPMPRRYRGIMLKAEGTAASSTLPGDWRYKDVQYE